jgi:hypothetical protein
MLAAEPEDEGYRVLRAHDGEEALTLLVRALHASKRHAHRNGGREVRDVRREG